jgi:hypothetical protein
VELVRFQNLGHAPQIQDPIAFHATLLKGMDVMRQAPAVQK